MFDYLGINARDKLNDPKGFSKNKLIYIVIVILNSMQWYIITIEHFNRIIHYQ